MISMMKLQHYFDFNRNAFGFFKTMCMMPYGLAFKIKDVNPRGKLLAAGRCNPDLRTWTSARHDLVRIARGMRSLHHVQPTFFLHTTHCCTKEVVVSVAELRCVDFLAALEIADKSSRNRPQSPSSLPDAAGAWGLQTPACSRISISPDRCLGTSDGIGMVGALMMGMG